MDIRHSARRGVPSVCRLRCGSDNKTREDPGNLQQQDKGLPRGTLCSATSNGLNPLQMEEPHLCSPMVAEGL